MKIDLPLLIPAAGLGSRLFPVTWGIPKELFPLGNKPALHYLLEEALIANIKEIYCVTSPRKEALIKYLSYKKDLNIIPLSKDESDKLINLDFINSSLNYKFFVQSTAKGVGNAMLCAYDELKEKDFFCMAYPDDIISNLNLGINSLVNVHKEFKCTVIAVEKVLKSKVSSYGIIKYDNVIEKNIFNVNQIIEKPKEENAPSEYAIIGRYILSNNILKNIKNMEIPCFITALNNSIKNGELVLALLLDTQRYDIGSVSGWIDAVNALNNNNLYIPNLNDYIIAESLESK